MDKPSALITVFIAATHLLVVGLVSLSYLGVPTFAIGILAAVVFLVLNVAFVMTRSRTTAQRSTSNWKKQLLWFVVGLLAGVSVIFRLFSPRR
jgi:uncharacterized metal-binding protein